MVDMPTVYPPRDPMAEAQFRWPFLKSVPYKYSTVPWRTNLESWPPGETGTHSYPRPKEIPPGQFGLEIFDRGIRAGDVLADYVSHGMRFSDPKIKDYYERFGHSLTQDQHRTLQEQYAWARRNEGERRPYPHWLEHSGMPALFRGYAFKQLGDYMGSPEKFNQHYYTEQQRQMIDEMMNYINAGAH